MEGLMLRRLVLPFVRLCNERPASLTHYESDILVLIWINRILKVHEDETIASRNWRRERGIDSWVLASCAPPQSSPGTELLHSHKCSDRGTCRADGNLSLRVSHFGWAKPIGTAAGCALDHEHKRRKTDHTNMLQFCISEFPSSWKDIKWRRRNTSW